jgi:alpha-tubulin suppressor-like RCC1 family protein
MGLSISKFGTLSSFKVFSIFMSKLLPALFIPFLLIGCGDDGKIAVVAENSYSFTIDSNGEVYAAGENIEGQLGLGNTGINSNCNIHAVWNDYYYLFFPYCKTFTKVSSLEGKNITSIAAGESHSLALDSNGNVYGAGNNDDGQLGFKDTADYYVLDHRKFTEIPSLNGKKITAIAAGDSFSLALGSDGKVYATGYDNFAEVSSLKGKNITTIVAGRSHSFAIDSDGKVYASGANSYGQLGFGDMWQRNGFTEVTSLNGKNIIAISAGEHHSIAVDSDGKVYTAGDNDYGQLGLGDDGYRTNRYAFTEVPSLNGKNITAVVAGTYHSFAIDSNGKAYGTGNNGHSELGLGDKNNRNTFTEIPSLNGKNIISIAAGSWHSLAVDSEGKIYATGNNYDGQLGLDDTKDRHIFTEIKD